MTNPTDPEQSIFGGARYFRQVYEKIPTHVPEPDRTWFALAAYNIGYGHLEDARVLTQKAGRDPDSWQDVREFLPLLEQEHWYTQTENGYARGWEPVRYVDNVRGYRDLLEWAWGAGARRRRDRLELAPRLEEIAAAARRFRRCTRRRTRRCRCVELGLARQVDDAAAGAGLLIPGAEHHSRDPRVEHRTDAHRARLQGHVQRGPSEPIIALPLRRGAQCDDLRMSRRIVADDRPVPPLADHFGPAPTRRPPAPRHPARRAAPARVRAA